MPRSQSLPSARFAALLAPLVGAPDAPATTPFSSHRPWHPNTRRPAGVRRVIEERSAATPAAFRDRVRLAQAAAAGMALLVVVFLTGCGSSEYPRLPLHPVTGKVIFNDKPATGAWVVFHPKSGDLALPRARAKVDSQGNYALATYEPQDGAPAGEYVVTVELYPLDQETKEAGPNVIPPKYVSPLTSPIVAHVAEGPNSVPITIKR